MNLTEFLYKRKFEVLFVALFQHLFVGVILADEAFYTEIVWPINMFILGIGLVGVYIGKERWKKVMRNVLFVAVVAMPLFLHFSGITYRYMEWISIVYSLFFGLILYELVRFMMRPGYINIDLISAAICGYLVLLEITVFIFQICYYHNPNALKGIDDGSPASIYMDMVYYCSVTLTSIGFGDIVPGTHATKLITAFFGIVGQLYSVVLVGILISKFSSRNSNS